MSGRQPRYAVYGGKMGLRSLKHRPRKIVDLRHKPMVSMKDLDDAITKFYMQWGERPQSIRLSRPARAGFWGAHKDVRYQGARLTL